MKAEETPITEEQYMVRPAILYCNDFIRGGSHKTPLILAQTAVHIILISKTRVELVEGRRKESLLKAVQDHLEESPYCRDANVRLKVDDVVNNKPAFLNLQYQQVQQGSSKI